MRQLRKRSLLTERRRVEYYILLADPSLTATLGYFVEHPFEMFPTVHTSGRAYPRDGGLPDGQRSQGRLFRTVPIVADATYLTLGSMNRLLY
jgi:hypothetical protein